MGSAAAEVSPSADGGPFAGRELPGKVVAAANISTHASRTSPEEARGKLLPHLLETVARIEAELRVTPNPRTGALSQ